MTNKSSLWWRLLWVPILLITLVIIYIGVMALWLFNGGRYPKHNFTEQAWSTDQEKRYETDSSDHWTYYLGFRPGFINIDPDVLEIKFENGKVITVTQRET